MIGTLCTNDALALDPEKAITQYLHQSWTTADGMPQSSVMALLRSRSGYLYCGTQEGLARFDGVRFRVYDKHEEQAFQTNTIRALCETRDGSLWIGTTSGLIRYRDGRFQAFGAPDGLPSPLVFALHEDRQGRLLVATRKGVCILNQDRLERPGWAKDLPESSVRCFLEDRDGRLWIGGKGLLLCLQEGSLKELWRGGTTPDKDVISLVQARDGTIWVGTHEKVGRIHNGNFQTPEAFQSIPKHQIYAILEDSGGNLWVATYGGGLLRYRQGKLDVFRAKEGLNSDLVVALHEDREGNLWIGTNGGGLHRFRDGLFTSITPKEGLSQSIVWSMGQDSEGALWIGTNGGGANRLLGGHITTLTRKNGLPHDDVLTVLGTRDGRVCFGTRGGLAIYRKGSMEVFTTDQGLRSNAVRALWEDPDGTLWVGTQNAGLHRLEGRRALSVPLPVHGDAWVHWILTDRRGNRWIATSDGLLQMRDGIIQRHDDSAIGVLNAHCLYQDSQGKIWIGTEGGISLWDEGQFSRFSMKDGLHGDAIFGILEDEKQNLWLSGNRGVFRIPMKDFAELKAGRRNRLRTTIYGLLDGMASNECNGGTQYSAFQDRNRRFWFASISGAISVRPTRAEEGAFSWPVLVESLRVDGDAIEPSRHPRIKPGSSRYEFAYTALSLASPAKIQFRYQLEGYDKDWVESGTIRHATFTNLPPGDYCLKVQAGYGDGVWSQQEGRFSFTQLPHFYQTWWFYLLSVGTLLGGFFGVQNIRERSLRRKTDELDALVQERTRQLQETNQELVRANTFKSMFLANTSHELRTPLNAILGLSRLLKESLLPEGERKQFVGTIQHSAEALLHILNDILDVSKIEAGRLEIERIPFDLRKTIEEAFILLAEKAQEKGLELLIEVDPKIPDHLLGDPIRLRQAVLNLANNAVKFTSKGHVLARAILEQADQTKVRFRLEVEDTGIGIPPEVLERLFTAYGQADSSTARQFGGTGLGLFITQQLAQLMDGGAGAESQVGQGSRFWISIQLQRAADQPPPEPSWLEGQKVRILGATPSLKAILGGLVQSAGGSILEEGGADLWIADGLDALEQTPPSSRRLLLLPLIHLGDARTQGLMVLRKPFGEPSWNAAIRQLRNVSAAEPTLELKMKRWPSFHGTVLVADDNPGNQLVAEALLKRFGLDCVRVSNGLEAIQVLEGQRFDLVLLDGRMPELDGLATAAEIRRREANGGPWEGHHLPLVALTGLIMPGDRQHFLQGGFDDYLAKPLEPMPLFEVLKQFLKQVPKSGNVSVLNRDRLKALLDALGGEEALKEFMEAFVQDGDQRMLSLQAALDAGDRDKLSRIAHDFKSNAANLGFTSLGESCHYLEIQAVNLSESDLLTSLEEIRQHFSNARVASGVACPD